MRFFTYVYYVGHYLLCTSLYVKMKFFYLKWQYIFSHEAQAKWVYLLIRLQDVICISNLLRLKEKQNNLYFVRKSKRKHRMHGHTISTEYIVPATELDCSVSFLCLCLFSMHMHLILTKTILYKKTSKMKEEKMESIQKVWCTICDDI